LKPSHSRGSLPLSTRNPLPQATDITGAGFVSRLTLLLERGFPFPPYEAAEFICAVGDEVETLATILVDSESDEGWFPWAEAASRHGRTGFLQQLLQRGALEPQRIRFHDLLGFWGRSADNEHRLFTFRWLLEHLTGEGVPEVQRHPLMAEVFREAARFGDLPLLQLLRQRGCPWDAKAWSSAASNGCTAVLEWLHEAGCPKPVRPQAKA
jgi:hypothetical protein